MWSLSTQFSIFQNMQKKTKSMFKPFLNLPDDVLHRSWNREKSKFISKYVKSFVTMIKGKELNINELDLHKVPLKLWTKNCDWFYQNFKELNGNISMEVKMKIHSLNVKKILDFLTRCVLHQIHVILILVKLIAMMMLSVMSFISILKAYVVFIMIAVVQREQLRMLVSQWGKYVT